MLRSGSKPLKLSFPHKIGCKKIEVYIFVLTPHQIHLSLGGISSSHQLSSSLNATHLWFDMLFRLTLSQSSISLVNGNMDQVTNVEKQRDFETMT